jgi:hypothetical protein
VGDAQVVERAEQQRAGTGEQGGAVGRRSVQVGLGIGGSAVPGAAGVAAQIAPWALPSGAVRVQGMGLLRAALGRHHDLIVLEG